jgi:hypothetical protein
MMLNFAVRWSGWLLIAGAVLFGFAVVKISLQPVINQQFTPGISRVFVLASILLLLSFPFMYVKQGNSAGWLGLAGFILLQAGIVMIVILASTPILYPSITNPPGENPVLFLLGIALTLGLLLTGIATIRADIFPRWSGILMLVAMAGFFFVFFVAEFLPPITGQIGSSFFAILLALSLVWIGASMWAGEMP